MPFNPLQDQCAVCSTTSRSSCWVIVDQRQPRSILDAYIGPSNAASHCISSPCIGCCSLPALPGEREGAVAAFPSLPSWGHSHLAPLLSAGFSGNFGDLLRHPSFSSELTKDPSFNSIMFHSLLSHKSEDQSALVIPLAHIFAQEVVHLCGHRYWCISVS